MGVSINLNLKFKNFDKNHNIIKMQNTDIQKNKK